MLRGALRAVIRSKLLDFQQVAIRHPFGGDVSVQLPVPKAPLLAKRGANQRFALLTLFAILQLQLLHPPLKLGDRPRLLEQFAQSVPFGLSEVDTYIVLPKPKRECWPLLLGQRREEMLAVPR